MSEAPMFERVVKVHTLVRDGMIGQVLRPAILVIGCGGTGGWVIPHVARLIKSLGVGSLTVADGDTVERKNLGRQNFVERDLGECKAIALAKRYSAAFGMPIKAIPGMLDSVRGLERQDPDIVLGCVDAHAARRIVAEWIAGKSNRVWLDSGNERVAGQVVCGYVAPPSRLTGPRTTSVVLPLPAVSQLYPLPTETAPRPSCAALVETATQTATVNVIAASIMANFLRIVLEDCLAYRVVNGRHGTPKGLEFHAVTFNVGNGGFATRWNTEANLREATKMIAPWLAA